MANYIIGITGASGSIYGKKLIEVLLGYDHHIFLTITASGKEVVKEELGLDLFGEPEAIEKKIQNFFSTTKDQLTYYDVNHIGAAIASGSFKTDGMIVAPCSMATASAIAHGASRNLLERAADVIMKENKPLILMPRESPLSVIHLENLLKLARCQVSIIPPMPAFYNHPETIDDIVNFTVGRVLDQLGIDHDLVKRWS